MVDDRPDEAETQADAGRRRREPPTIDGEATEIPRASPPNDAKAETEAEAVAKPETDTQNSASAAAPAAPPRVSWIPTMVVSAAVGVVAAAVVLGAAAWAGWLAPPVPQVDPAAVDALSARVAKIEAQPTTAAPDTAIKAHVDDVAQALAAVRKDVRTLHAEWDSVAKKVDDLASSPHGSAGGADLSALTTRLAQVESVLHALSAQETRQTNAQADDKTLRRVLAATLLAQAVQHGDAYDAALSTAKSLALDPAALKPLDRFAGTGVPGATALSKALLDVIARLQPANPKDASHPAGTSQAGGILDRLKAGAEHLVRVRRVDGGDNAAGAAIGRAAAAARRGDVAAARRELAALAPADRAPFESWIAQVDARDAALAAARKLAAEATASLATDAKAQ
jgi:hypothetical protein